MSEKEKLFSHPLRAVLEAGLNCEDPDCSGSYVKKTRDISMKKAHGIVLIRDSEYWECENCGSFVTSREEVQRIREETKNPAIQASRFTLRLDPMLHQQLTQEAKKNHRSLNNELTFRLERSLKET